MWDSGLGFRALLKKLRVICGSDKMLAEQASCIKFWAPRTLDGLYGVL